MRRRLLLATILSMLALPLAARESLLLASTTSVVDSGLLPKLQVALERATGIRLRVVAVGSGQALALARRGDADLVLTHDPEAEEDFQREGYAATRVALMRNDFILLGPAKDPARTRGADLVAALRAIQAQQATFVSRGDGSGTHRTEQRLWRAAGFEPATLRGPWLRDIGAGMTQALNMAATAQAYVLSDRASWLAFAERRPGHGLAVLVQGDARVSNVYSLMVVSRARHAHTKEEAARRVAAWLAGPEARKLIAEFRIGGEQAFQAFPAP